MKKVAINGLGRIGRIVFKELINDKDIDIVAVNDFSSPEELVYLLKYDTVHGRFTMDVESGEDYIKCNGKRIKVYQEADALNLPWGDLEVDMVVECTGAYTKLEDAKKHIQAGAKCVIISAPGKGEMKTIVYGVNESTLTGSEEVISAASCTTNCLAPVLNVIEKNFGIDKGFMTTVHAYTNDQVNLDVHHKKGMHSRRGRACAANIIPTSTGAASAIGKVIPSLEGKMSGNALRVPVTDGSMIDLSLVLNKKVTVEEINSAIKNSESDSLKFTMDPIVSSDIIGNSTGALVDGLLTEVLGDGKNQLVKVVAWYDNEYGYSVQMVRTIKHYLSLK